MDVGRAPLGCAAKLGFWVAVILGCLGLLTIWVNPVEGAVQAALFLLIAWGIRRAQPGAGFAFLATLFGLPIVGVLRAALVGIRDPGQRVAFLVSVLLVLACAFLFLYAVPELRRCREHRALAWPWAAFTAVVVACSVLLRPMVVPSGGMADTLLAGDHLVVETASALLGRSPQRGDIVVFRYPIDIRQTFFERVIGVPGDRIRIDNKQVYRNGEKLNEPYKFHATEHIDSYRDNFPGVPNVRLYEPAQVMLDKDVVNGELVVPANCFFAMGDNRDSSLDSRYWGFITKADIIGRPVLIYASYDEGNRTLASLDDLLEDWDKFLNPRWDRFLRRP